MPEQGKVTSRTCPTACPGFLFVEEEDFVLLLDGACVTMKEETGVVNEEQKVRRLLR